MSSDRKEIVVIGAGVVGLSTAIRIQETAKYNVTIVAETFPFDHRTIRYTSHWAGAHHVSQAFEDARQKAMDKETFETMWKDSEPGSGAAAGIFNRNTHTEYHADGIDPSPWLDYMPDYRTVPEHDLIPGSTAGYTFTTLTLNTYAYLNWLLARFLSRGGSTKRMSLQHICQVLDNTANPAAIVACPGIGARFLGGIEDKDVYPIRGQTVLLRAPWIKYSRTLNEANGSYVYMMPHCTGDVLVGGIKVPDDWYPSVRATDRNDILTRALARLCPELAPLSVRESREATVQDLEALVVDEGCGLRPARKGGIRLEAGSLETGDGGKIPVVYNYGHSGMGYQSSWGSASLALALLDEAIC